MLTPTRARSDALGGTGTWLVGILATGLALRLVLLPFRWINPDEGAHLMDGQLILHGLIPFVHFQSRQPLYAYLQAGLLAAFHGSYLLARLLPVAAVMGTAVFIFLIARRLFNERIALLATAIYVFHPLVVIWSPIVKTEPLTAFLSSAAIYCTVRFLQSEHGWSFLAVAGMLLGLAFYVRQSSLAVATAIIVFLFIALRRQPAHLARAYAAFAAGGLLIVALAAAYYARYMTAAQLWQSGLNPLHLVIGAADAVASSPAPGAGATAATDSGVRLALQTWATTIDAVRETLRLDAFLFAGIAVSLVVVAYLRVRQRLLLKRHALPLTLLYCWAFALMLAYGYWAIHRGYFTQYFGETIPPLAIVLAFTLWYLTGILAPASTGVGPAIVLGAGLVAVFAAYRWDPSLEVPHIALVVGLALVVALVYRRDDGRRRWAAMLGIAVAALVVGGAAGGWAGPQRLATAAKALVAVVAVVAIAYSTSGRQIERAAYLGLMFIVVTFVSAFTASGRVMSVAYQCVWSPRTVSDVTRYLRTHSTAGDQVMSGAMIWAVAAKRPPFMMISHPLAFDGGAPRDMAARMNAYLHATPPRFIVLDGYTNRTYLSYLDPDGRFLATRYRLVEVFPGSRHPVKVYSLTDTAVTRR
ncbi:MAG TPA: glycosyltransferase family 39 protein [Gemmatimonadaceae bacterium]